MSAHVSKVIKSANYHLRNIGKIRKNLNTGTTNSAIVSLVTSRLDYCNGPLCGITDELSSYYAKKELGTSITDLRIPMSQIMDFQYS